MPVQDQLWSLMWSVVEVVRDDLVSVTTEDLVTIAGERPPTVLSPDLRSMARLSVNDRGDAEWAVVGGSNPRGEVIEPDAERKEVEAENRARRAAEAGVDWTRLRDVHRAPELTYGDADGCRDLFVYAWSADRAEAVTVRASRNDLRLSTAPQVFDIARQQVDLEVVVHVFESPQRSWRFCSDVGFSGPGNPLETWKAVAGAVTIELSPSGIRVREPYSYRARIRIEGAEFVSATGVRVRQVRPITVTAIVHNWGSG